MRSSFSVSDTVIQKKQVFTDDLRTILLPSTHHIMLEEKLKKHKTNQKQTQIEEFKELKINKK